MKDDECCQNAGQMHGKGVMIVLAALLLAVGMMGGAFLLSKGDYSPHVNVTSGATNPNIYVTSSPPEHPISVSATSTKKVAPDLLEIGLRVETQSTNAKEAQQRNALVATTLLAKLKALGIEDKDIQTTSYNVYPVYDSQYNCDKSGMNCHYDSKLTGYKTVQSLNVDVLQLDKGGSVIDAASESGDNETFVDSTMFTLKPATRSEMAKTMLKEASTAAKEKAQRIADGLGATLGKVLSASESSYYPQPYYNMYKNVAMEAAAAPAPTPLSQGTVDVSVSVSVAYEVGS
jgi:uncharacterized protein YggE